ncbi:MAG TPA: hypothetical protein VHP13_05820 [Gammaproteobacteria bacterium]|jgi:hypothetical protein|nr:hypothetical protein [Gammaproteobacteria bacterium]
MVSLAQLWLPIVVAAIGIFAASSIVHMVLQFWHRPDYHKFSNEDEVRAAIRKGSPAPGMYMVPYCPPETMKDPATLQKFTEGPVGFMIVRANGVFNMGKSLGQWFAFCLLAAVFAGYLGSITLPAGDAPMHVFRVITTVGLMAFGFGTLPMVIWYGQPWKAASKDLVDALLYSLVMAAVFMWLWPHAV